MFSAATNRALRLAVIFFAVVSPLSARADSWTYWGQVASTNVTGPKLATDGTNIFYSTILDGVYRATLADRNFSLMPMTGFPLWDANTNTNGFGVFNLAVTPSGQMLISGTPLSVTTSNGGVFINAFTGALTNTLPVFYWWDETNQLWHAATVTGRNYPYTVSAGNFTFAPDGAVWTCSGFASYAYRSTNNGHSYTAFDLVARMPTNYLSFFSAIGQTPLGKVFSILATPQNQIIVGTETSGYLRTTNNGTNWTSLDPNFTDTNSVNPLGRVGNAIVAGLDKYGNVLCKGFAFAPAYPCLSNWTGVTLIGWRSKDGAVFGALHGLPATITPLRVVTPPSGVSFTFLNQNYLLQGGAFRALDGKNWAQFNQGSGLDVPFAPGLTNVQGQGNCITTLGNLVFIGVGSFIYNFDSTPPPVVNRPPVALPQAVNLWENSPANLTLTGSDADGDALNLTVTTPPAHGTLTGTPPNLAYTPPNNFLGLDEFQFVASDGAATSAPAIFNLAVNSLTNPPPVISFNSPTNGSWFLAPTNLILSAKASDNGGFVRVNFYDGVTLLGALTNAPFTLTVTNPAVGEHTFFARATDSFSARTWAPPATVSILPVTPLLKISRADSEKVAVTWPLDLDGFFLESSANVNGPWTLSPYPQLYLTNGQTATIPLGDQQFFRLMHPF